jgi:porin
MRTVTPILFIAITSALAGAAQAEIAADSPVRFETAYTGDVVSNRSGGRRHGERYLDNVDVTLTLDGERLWNIPGFTLFAYGLHNSGGGFSEAFVGDSFTASNIDAPAATRLYEAWVDWQFGDDSVHSVRAGLYDLNSEFDVSDTRSLFINSAFGIGQDIAQTGANGPSIFPVASFGVRLDVQLAPRWRLLSAALDGVPGDSNDPTATEIRFDHDDGLLLITELQRLALGAVVEKLAVGVWGYTQPVDRIASDEAESTSTAHNSGWYVSADSRFGFGPDVDEQPWRTSLRVGQAEKLVNNHEWFVATALTYDVPRPASREHSVGLGLAWASTSPAFRATSESVEDYEATVELTWRAALTDWLTLQPTVQHIINTGSDRSLNDALVVGLRFEVATPALPW